MKFALLYDNAVFPKRKNSADAGIDLFAYFPDAYDGSYRVPSGDVVIFKTGVTVEIPKGYFGWITNKSSKNYLIGGGIVDENYQGELLVKICNVTDKPITIHHGDAIAQFLIIPCVIPKVEIVSKDEIHKAKSDRGSDGGIVRQKENI